MTELTQTDRQKIMNNIKACAPRGSVLHGDVERLSKTGITWLVAISVQGTSKDLTSYVGELFGMQTRVRHGRTYLMIEGIGVDIVKSIIDRLTREIYLDPEALKYDLEENSNA